MSSAMRISSRCFSRATSRSSVTPSRSRCAAIERERGRALVDLAALDADPAVLDHVDAAEAVRTDDRSELVDERRRRRGASPSSATGTPRSNADDDLAAFGRRVARVRGERVRLLGRRGPRVLDASPHSIARPHMFSSIEYSFSFVASIGMSHFAARSMQSARVRPHTRTGASTSRSGARARVDTSKRTWSLPFPVQP